MVVSFNARHTQIVLSLITDIMGHVSTYNSVEYSSHIYLDSSIVIIIICNIN